MVLVRRSSCAAVGLQGPKATQEPEKDQKEQAEPPAEMKQLQLLLKDAMERERSKDRELLQLRGAHAELRAAHTELRMCYNTLVDISNVASTVAVWKLTSC